MYLCSHVMSRKMTKILYAVKCQNILWATTLCVHKGVLTKRLEYYLLRLVPYYSFYYLVTCINCVLYSLQTNHFNFQLCAYSNIYVVRRLCVLLPSFVLCYVKIYQYDAYNLQFIRGYDVGPTKSVRLASHILTSGRVINKWRSDYRIQKGVHVESFLQPQNTLMTNSRIHLHKERGMYIARCRFMYDRVSTWQSSRHLRSDVRTRGVYVVLQ